MADGTDNAPPPIEATRVVARLGHLREQHRLITAKAADALRLHQQLTVRAAAYQGAVEELEALLGPPAASVEG